MIRKIFSIVLCIAACLFIFCGCSESSSSKSSNAENTDKSESQTVSTTDADKVVKELNLNSDPPSGMGRFNGGHAWVCCEDDRITLRY